MMSRLELPAKLAGGVDCGIDLPGQALLRLCQRLGYLRHGEIADDEYIHIAFRAGLASSERAKDKRGDDVLFEGS